MTLWRNDKIAYGAYYAYHNLHYFFNDALIETSNMSPVSFYGKNDSAAAYIIIGTNVRPDEKELKAILDYAGSGNHVFISAMDIGQNLLDSLHLAKTNYRNVYNNIDSLTISIQHPGSSDSSVFSYPGRSLDNVFTKMDTAITNILGKDQEGHANFVQFTYKNGGSLSLHLAPVAFTNFFLLHKNNKRYYDLTMSYIPASAHVVRWDDYYRSHIDGTDSSQRSFLSKLAAFLNNPVLRWAFWLAVVLFGLIYLFESKRKQRPVPVVKALRNSSLDFVQTIGRLYFQRRDNKNLAAKMSAHFLGQVRTKYNLSTSQTDESFEQKLSFKAGYPLALVKEITSVIRESENLRQMNDEELLAFSRKINEFYKQT
ncbi:MAG: hypothetical protein H0X41_00820 [Chitinophagaceae bacterium]|nr:hypothetical protein [Chitinophagaceae bacterium]